MAPSHYLNQCWIIVNWNLRNKLQWTFNRNYTFSFKKMHLKILSGKWWPFCLSLNVLLIHWEWDMWIYLTRGMWVDPVFWYWACCRFSFSTSKSSLSWLNRSASGAKTRLSWFKRSASGAKSRLKTILYNKQATTFKSTNPPEINHHCGCLVHECSLISS